MSTNRSRRIDPATAEQLLGGGKVGTSGGPAALADNAALAGLLAAAAAPAAGAEELPGEARALAAFREARRSPAHAVATATAPATGSRRRMIASTAPARALSAKSAKALLAALALTALGGVAVAAGTGNLPGLSSGFGGSGGSGSDALPIVGPTATVGTSPGGAATTPGAGGATGHAPTPLDARTSAPGHDPAASNRPDGRPGDHSGDQSGDPTGQGHPGGGVTADPGQQFGELCGVFEDRESAGAKPKQLLTDPLLAPLIKAAGGADRVEAFCVGLLGQGRDHGGPSAAPTHSGSPKGPGDPTGKLPKQAQFAPVAAPVTVPVAALTSGLGQALQALAGLTAPPERPTPPVTPAVPTG